MSTLVERYVESGRALEDAFAWLVYDQPAEDLPRDFQLQLVYTASRHKTLGELVAAAIEILEDTPWPEPLTRMLVDAYLDSPQAQTAIDDYGSPDDAD